MGILQKLQDKANVGLDYAALQGTDKDQSLEVANTDSSKDLYGIKNDLVGMQFNSIPQGVINGNQVINGTLIIKDTISGDKITTITGDQVQTGRISSVNGKTYFDLTNAKIVMNDGSNDRVLIGNTA